jgi:hypothetical protein
VGGAGKTLDDLSPNETQVKKTPIQATWANKYTNMYGLDIL